MKNKFHLASVAFASLSLGGCGFGLKVPEFQEGWDSPQDGETLVREISKTVYLSVEKAVVCAVNDPSLASQKSRDDFADNWAVQLTLQLQIQETSALSPGLSLNTPMHNGIVNFAGEYFGSNTVTVRGPWGGLVSGYPSTYLWGPATLPQSYSFGMGGKASTQATRTDSSGASFTVKQLLNNAKAGGRHRMEQENCSDQTIDEKARDELYPGDKEHLSKTAQFLSLIVNNDLKIYEWLRSALHIQTIIAEFGGNIVAAGKDSTRGIGQNAITHEVQFVVVTDGNVTPQWKLVRVTGNPNSPFFDASRSRTHDLIVTFGPKDPKTHKLMSEAVSQHNAALYGLSNVNGIRGLFTP